MDQRQEQGKWDKFRWRRTADSYPELQVSVFDDYSPFVEQVTNEAFIYFLIIFLWWSMENDLKRDF